MNNEYEYEFYKKNMSDIIWWVNEKDSVGKHQFSFDKKKIFNLFKDYPHELTPEQKEIFDKENPYWANFFKDRNVDENNNKVGSDAFSTLDASYVDIVVSGLVDKIKELSPNAETTIAQLLQLTNEDVAMTDPLTQGAIFSKLKKACEDNNIKIEFNRDEIGGLGYHYKLKKISVEPQNNYSQEELKEMFYKIMSKEEAQKVEDLGMNQEISKLNTSTFQIKYFNGIGYVFIGNGYLMMTDGTEKQQYFCTVCKDEESAKQEVIDRLNKLPNENQTTNNEENI